MFQGLGFGRPPEPEREGHHVHRLEVPAARGRREELERPRAVARHACPRPQHLSHVVQPLPPPPADAGARRRRRRARACGREACLHVALGRSLLIVAERGGQVLSLAAKAIVRSIPEPDQPARRAQLHCAPELLHRLRLVLGDAPPCARAAPRRSAARARRAAPAARAPHGAARSRVKP